MENHSIENDVWIFFLLKLLRRFYSSSPELRIKEIVAMIARGDCDENTWWESRGIC